MDIYISNLELDGGFLAHFVFTFHFMHSLISVSFVCLLITDMSVWMCVRCELKSKLDFAVNIGHISSVSRIARNGQQLLFCVCNYKANLSCLRQTFFFFVFFKQMSSSVDLICAWAIGILLEAFKWTRSKWASSKQLSVYIPWAFLPFTHAQKSWSKLYYLIYGILALFSFMETEYSERWTKTENK